jgi:conjugal transfer ATP-binding protein TraC
MSFLNGLSVGLDLQFVADITSGNESVIQNHKDSNLSTDPIVCEITQNRADRFLDYDQKGLLPAHGLKLFVRRQPKSALIEKTNLFKKNKNFAEISDDRLKQEIALNERLISDLMSELNRLSLHPQLLSAEDILKLIYQQWNPSRSVELGYVDPHYIREGLLFTDVGLYNTGFELGDFKYKVISLKLLPEQTFATMASRLRELPFDSKVFLTIHVPDQTKEIESLKTQRRMAYAMVTGKKSGVSDLESRAKLNDLENLLEQMVASGEKVFQMSLQIVLKSQDSDDLDTKVSETLSKLREMAGIEAMEETLASFDIFSEIAIPHAKTTERTKRIKSSNLCDLLPVYGPWKGHSEPKILLRSRLGSLMSFNPFSSDLGNFNQIVSGGSGSGKSYLTNLLMMQMFKDNPKVFIIDIGGSYEKLCNNFKGQYIHLGVDTKLSINPFDLAVGETAPTSQKIKFLLSLVEIMTKENEQAQLGKLEKSLIESAIEEVYQTSKAPRLSDLKNILLNHSEKSLVRIGKILNSWCGNSAYGKFVDQPTTLQLNSNIVSFDLKGMDDYEDLQSACLFIITDYVWREVQRDRSKMKFLVFDECWKLMENDSAQVFISEVFRTFRKYMASVIAISQNMDDFAKSKIASAILPNSSVKWVLKQKGSDFERLKDILGLNPNEVQLIQSLSQERGVYSEAFLMAEDNKSVVLIESSPLEYWLATTDGRDLGKIQEYKVKHPDFDELSLLKKLAQDFPIGFAAVQNNNGGKV